MSGWREWKRRLTILLWLCDGAIVSDGEERGGEVVLVLHDDVIVQCFRSLCSESEPIDVRFLREVRSKLDRFLKNRPRRTHGKFRRYDTLGYIRGGVIVFNKHFRPSTHLVPVVRPE